jgi:hypothetical protein
VIEREATRRSNLQLLAMKRATRLCRKARREMGWHVVTRHHGPEPLFENLFCIRTHPSLSSSLPFNAASGFKGNIHHHQAALDLDSLLFSIQIHSFSLRSTSERPLEPDMSNQGPQLRHKASEPATGKVSHQDDLRARSNAFFSTLELINPFLTISHVQGASIAEEREKQAALKAYANDEGHFSLVRNFRMADIITLGNAVCGTLCIFLCIRYLSLSANMSGAPSEEAMTSLCWAHFLPMLGFGFDALDGRVARMMGGGSLLGQELDSLADLVSTRVKT